MWGMGSKGISNGTVAAEGTLGLAELEAVQEFQGSQVRASLENKNEENWEQCLGPDFFC